jgi:hypothetical protein
MLFETGFRWFPNWSPSSCRRRIFSTSNIHWMFSVRSCSKKGRPWPETPAGCLVAIYSSQAPNELVLSYWSNYIDDIDSRYIYITIIFWGAQNLQSSANPVPTSGLQKSSQRPSKKDITASIAPLRAAADSWIENPGHRFKGMSLYVWKRAILKNAQERLFECGKWR